MNKPIPRPEHPEPMFKRESWLNLNGEWDFEIDNSVSGLERGYFKPDTALNSKIIVPFCPESELSGVNFKDFMAAVWYRKEINLSAEQVRGNVLLHFGAVDFCDTVYINGSNAGVHKGGYASFTLDITKFVREGKNVITVYALDDVRSPMQARGKQSEEFHSHACDYTRTTGIWQTVWLEFVPEDYIKSVKYIPDPENVCLGITAFVKGRGTLKAEAFFGGKCVGSTQVSVTSGTAAFTLPLTEKHLWEVNKGGLYDLVFTFGEDRVESYFGLRDLCLDGYKFLINGKSVFQRLVLDQGFYPDGIYTAPTDEALINDIKLSQAVGFNGARLHQKVFEARFLYHCDRLGYIVWGEYGNWGLDYSDFSVIKNVLPEWTEIVERDFNHPAIVGWCPFNETWDYRGRQQDKEVLRVIYRTTKALDRTRPCIDTSGNYHVETDIFDVHDYDQNPETFKEHYDALMEDGELFSQLENRRPNRQIYEGGPTFVSEYGGIKWSVSSGDSKAWGYGDAPKSIDEFMTRYKGLTDALLDNNCMFGFCYTQLYDIEQEQNGIYTYSREAKFDCDALKAINSRKAKIED